MKALKPSGKSAGTTTQLLLPGSNRIPPVLNIAKDPSKYEHQEHPFKHAIVIVKLSRACAAVLGIYLELRHLVSELGSEEMTLSALPNRI